MSGSLKNLKPEKIGPWAKFNRHIHVLIPKSGGAQCIVQQWPPYQNKYKYNIISFFTCYYLIFLILTLVLTIVTNGETPPSECSRMIIHAYLLTSTREDYSLLEGPIFQKITVPENYLYGRCRTWTNWMVDMLTSSLLDYEINNDYIFKVKIL